MQVEAHEGTTAITGRIKARAFDAHRLEAVTARPAPDRGLAIRGRPVPTRVGARSLRAVGSGACCSVRAGRVRRHGRLDSDAPDQRRSPTRPFRRRSAAARAAPRCLEHAPARDAPLAAPCLEGRFDRVRSTPYRGSVRVSIPLGSRSPHLPAEEPPHRAASTGRR
jgi:hypothetical protein